MEFGQPTGGANWLNDLELYQAREARLERQAQHELQEHRMHEPPPDRPDGLQEIEPRLNPYACLVWHRCPACFWWSFLPVTGVFVGDNGCWTCAKCDETFDITVYMRQHSRGTMTIKRTGKTDAE